MILRISNYRRDRLSHLFSFLAIIGLIGSVGCDQRSSLEEKTLKLISMNVDGSGIYSLKKCKELSDECNIVYYIIRDYDMEQVEDMLEGERYSKLKIFEDPDQAQSENEVSFVVEESTSHPFFSTWIESPEYDLEDGTVNLSILSPIKRNGYSYVYTQIRTVGGSDLGEVLIIYDQGGFPKRFITHQSVL